MQVRAGIFPVSGADFDALAAAVERLTLNDASVGVQRETSAALGAGFRCGWGAYLGGTDAFETPVSHTPCPLPRDKGLRWVAQGPCLVPCGSHMGARGYPVSASCHLPHSAAICTSSSCWHPLQCTPGGPYAP